MDRGLFRSTPNFFEERDFFIPCCPPNRNNSDVFITLRVRHNNDLLTKKAKRQKAPFTVIKTIIRHSVSHTIKNLWRKLEIDAMTPEIRKALGLIPFKSYVRFHVRM